VEAEIQARLRLFNKEGLAKTLKLQGATAPKSFNDKKNLLASGMPTPQPTGGARGGESGCKTRQTFSHLN